MKRHTDEYQLRRRELAKRLSPNSIAIIPAAREILRNGDVEYRFRQNSNFYYLTGFNEPDALLVITSGDPCISVLWNRPSNPEQEQWTGKRLGQDQACSLLGVDYAYSIDDIESRLAELMAGKQVIYTLLGQDPVWEAKIMQIWQKIKTQVRRGITAPECFSDLALILDEMRLFKRPEEIKFMRDAAKITVRAHQQAMRSVRQAQFEYQLEASLWYEFMQAGCRHMAYDPIVASGQNACILHYTANNQPLQPGELVLIDAGAELDCYAADVTRTFPINGHFSPEQRAIYALVLRAQQEGIACIRPGCSWDEIQRKMIYILTFGLIDLGLLHGDVDDLIAAEAYKPFYMHNSGHWLGLDVHDAGQYRVNGQWRALNPGMVLTVEPGLYIQAGSNVDERWWGIGVRIEDDILVTEQGHENLTIDLAVEIDEIEAYVRG